MLDSGVNVMDVPWKENMKGMKGDPTMCALVGNNRAEGLIVARLNTQNRTHLIVAVQEARLDFRSLISFELQSIERFGGWSEKRTASA